VEKPVESTEINGCRCGLCDSHACVLWFKFNLAGITAGLLNLFIRKLRI